MSGNEKSIKVNHSLRTQKMDARVRRTRDALGNALVTLILEKPFDDITIQEVLDRAGVGRSTFYSHFSDKDDLLFSDADEFFEGMSMALSIHERVPQHIDAIQLAGQRRGVFGCTTFAIAEGSATAFRAS